MSKPDSFLKSVSTLLSGTLLSMVVSLIAQVILARFFNEEAFGILATFQALVTTFSIGPCPEMPHTTAADLSEPRFVATSITTATSCAPARET